MHSLIQLNQDSLLQRQVDVDLKEKVE